jgi:hypothetical protein
MPPLLGELGVVEAKDAVGRATNAALQPGFETG